MFGSTDPNRALSGLLQQHLGLKGAFPDQLVQARRILPRALRADVDLLRKVEACAGNPHIARQFDAARVADARRSLRAWLTGPGPRQRRQTRLIGALLSLGFSLVLGYAVMALVILA